MRQSNFSKNLNDLLEKRRLTLTTVSRKAGVSKSTLHGWLYGTPPKILNPLIRLADFFEIPLDELIFEKVQKRQKQPLETRSKLHQGAISGRYLLTIEPFEIEK